jgi:SAM-dependent methyltransferase
MNYDKNYYHANAQDSDRPALWMYERLWRRYLGNGPVLEFGCGVGCFARRLSRHTEVFGLESNTFALSQIGKTAQRVQVITTTSGLLKQSLGSITALHVFEHIPDNDLVSLGAEFNRILKIGGRILAVMPDLDGRAHTLKGVAWSAFRDSTHINLKGADKWRHLFETVWELDVVTCFADGYYDFPYGPSRMGSLAGDALRAARTFIQFIAARPLLRQGDGENAVFILEKRS